MTSSGSIPAIIVSDFDTETEDHKVVFKPKNQKKLAKIEIVLPSVPEIVETLKLPKTEIDENEQTSTSNATISEEKQETSTTKSVISKFTKKAKVNIFIYCQAPSQGSGPDPCQNIVC